MAGTAGVTPADVLTDIATGRRRVPLADARPRPDPALENLIEDTMTLDPSVRGLGRVDVTPVDESHARP